MPDLQEIIKERNVKKFTKKSYRPWDLTGKASAIVSESDLQQGTTLEAVENEIDSAKSSPTETKSTIDTNKVPNRYQTDTTLDTKQIANRYQMDSNKISNGYQIDTQLDTKQISVREPTPDLSSYFDFKKEPEENDAFSQLFANESIDNSSMFFEQEILSLSGKQKIIFDAVIELCSARKGLATGPVQTASLANLAQTTIGTTKTILKRLIDKQLIVRNPGKNAKGGYINLGITANILDLVKNIKQTKKTNAFASDLIIANRYQIDTKDEHSSSYINNITTNLNKKNEQVPPEWEAINFDPLVHIGFSKHQIKQMIGKNDPTVVQEAIHHFAYGLEHNPKVKSYEDPLNVLMGVLRKGQAWVETNYRSAIEVAQEKLLQAKRAELERKKSLEDEAFKLALSEWDAGLTEPERHKISERKHGDLTPPAAKLSKYFRDNIWPSKKGEYLLF